MSLRDLLDEATAKPPLPAERHPRKWSEYARATVILNQLAPEMAALLLEAQEMFGAAHKECVGRFNPRLCNVCALLARIDRLGKEQT